MSIEKIKAIINENLSLNILVIGVMTYLAVMCLMTERYSLAVAVVISGILYIAGALLGNIRKFIPMIVAVLSIVVFAFAVLLILLGKNIGIGFVIFGTAVIFFAITGYDSITGARCIPYCIAMFGAECVFCFNGDTRAMVVFVAALTLSVLFSMPTYTAMSKYVFTVFLCLAMIKFTGIWHVLRGTQPQGLQKAFIDNVPLYIITVVLGIVSLLLRERHPRIKSDRDKKMVPALKQWQVIIGVSIFMTVFWGLANQMKIFETDASGISASMKMNLLYLASIAVLSDSTMMSIYKLFGFVPLMLFVMMMVGFIYKAYVNYKQHQLFEDKLILLMMVGFFVSFAYFEPNIPVMMLYGVLSGCAVNGSYKAK